MNIFKKKSLQILKSKFNNVKFLPIINLQTNQFSFKTTSLNSGVNSKAIIHNSLRFFSKTYPPHIVLKMPALSPTMEKGNILSWSKKVGDKVKAGESIASLETDKAILDFDVQEDGYLAKILIPAGTKDVLVNIPVAIIAEENTDIKAFENYQSSSSSAPPKDTPTPTPTPIKETPKQSAPTAKKYPPHVQLKMPALSPTMDKGNLLKWNKNIGDKIKAGEAIASLETDKAILDFDVQEDGYIAKLLVNPGTKDILVNTLVAIICEEKDDVKAFEDYEAGSTASASSPKPTKTETQPETKEDTNTHEKPSSDNKKNDRVFASPLAKKIASEKGFNLSEIEGTGPNGRIIKADVLEYSPKKIEKKETVVQEAPKTVSKPAAVQTHTPTISDQFVDVELTNMRRVIAERLLFSKTSIPHFYVTVDVELDSLLKLRENLNKNSKSKISVNDIVIKATALSCMRYPDVNSSFMGTFIRKHNNVDVSVAVSTDKGLITPIVFSAQSKGLEQISAEMKDLSERARESKLKLNEFQGGTISISNMGMFGINSFSAIINPPQACILAVGSAISKVLPDENAKDKANPYRIAKVMSVTLSSDHRVVDGVLAAKWVNEFKRLLENPELMLL